MSSINPGVPLLPCPFCGGTKDVFIFHDMASDYIRDWRYIPQCENCELEGRFCATEEEAIRWWNTRAPEAGTLPAEMWINN